MKPTVSDSSTLASAGQFNGAQLGIERGEHARRLQNVRAGEAIEQRALAGVGVADQRNGGHRHRLAALALLPAHAPHRFEIELELVDAALNPAAIGFKLRFAGSAGADAAAQLRHGFAASGQPRQHVLKLRQLHLQLAFARARVAGKDVEDQLRSVEHAAGKRRLKVAQLRGRQIVVEEHQVGFGGGCYAGNLFHLAGADQRGRIGPGAALHQLGGNFAAGARHQFAKLRQRFFRIESGRLWARSAADERFRSGGFDGLSIRQWRRRTPLARTGYTGARDRGADSKVHSHQNRALGRSTPGVGWSCAACTRHCQSRPLLVRLSLLRA